MLQPRAVVGLDYLTFKAHPFQPKPFCDLTNSARFATHALSKEVLCTAHQEVTTSGKMPNKKRINPSPVNCSLTQIGKYLA